MIIKQNRFLYGALILITIALGLFARKVAYPYLPDLINDYLGDALWASMIFFIFRFLLIRKDVKPVAIYSLLFCFLIEISQLYHAPWIDTVRATTLGALVLGSGFLWSDLLAYTIGVSLAAALDILLRKRNNKL